jgi:hypothetical protein
MKTDAINLQRQDGLRKLLRDPTGMRAFLSKPLRLNKIPPGKHRDAVEKEESEKRVRALHVLYSIPEDWPPDIRWEWIARHLAGELFAGCRTITKGLGGPSRERRVTIEEQKRALFSQFEAYRANNAYQSRRSSAVNFVKANQIACKAVGLHDAKSFAQAMKKIGIKTVA